MIELVIFDVAGTTIADGDAVASCFRAALASAEVRPSSVRLAEVMGLHKPQAIRILLSDAGRAAPESLVDAVHDDFSKRMIDYYHQDPAVRPIPGAEETFARLRGAGLKLALDTGFGRAILDAVLERLGWNAAFDATVASDEVKAGRPAADMIQSLMARLDVASPDRVAKIGDTIADVEEGINAGCGRVFAVLTGTGTRECFAAYPGVTVLPSVADLPGQLLRDGGP